MENVMYYQYQDLVFRSFVGTIKSGVYSVDYYQWILAGVGNNMRGYNNQKYSIAEFAKLFKIIKQVKETGDTTLLQENKDNFANSIVLFYADLFKIYIDHIKAIREEVSLRRRHNQPDFTNIIIIPSFTGFPELESILPKETVQLSGYESENPRTFQNQLAALHFPENNRDMISGAAILWDYQHKVGADQVLLDIQV